MKYFQRRRLGSINKASGAQPFSANDPLTGLANLLDLGLVLVVGMFITLFSVYHLQDLLSEKNNFTLMKKAADGQMEIITKEGRKINAVKVTRDTAKGLGTRLGIAYRLEDGSMVYVPEAGDSGR